MTQAEALRRRVCWACLRRSSVKSVAVWADRYRYLSSESAAEHGKWSTLPFQYGPVHRKFKLPARPKFTPVQGCPALGSASDKKNSVNLALVLGLNRILTQNAAAE